ncbi:hypothetical protein CC80DRAFT_592132 [Byssothecium circinans]|uniref:DUF7730 domain-containing protein n=1 Tax=Byssothecium circinans TaxID=147558 RepID=A0A6A5U0P8_9PLEO|nr:hypothetical protein CC80DRAFT_592132 [Byssothecium circinans]
MAPSKRRMRQPPNWQKKKRAKFDSEKNKTTTRNAEESPLLRLPAEIRNEIWELAFGHRNVHPHIEDVKTYWTRSKSGRHQRTITYSPCDPGLSTQEQCNTVMRGGGELAVGISGTWEDSRSYYRLMGKEETASTLVPLVCKQIYYEALSLVWETTTFTFNEPRVFQRFLNAPTSRLDLVQQLGLAIGLHRLSDSNEDIWPGVLMSPSFSALTAVSGINLVAKVHQFHWPPLYPDPYYIFGVLINELRGFPLKPERTTVFVISDRALSSQTGLDLATKTRTRLLNTKSLSRRGEE